MPIYHIQDASYSCYQFWIKIGCVPDFFYVQWEWKLKLKFKFRSKRTPVLSLEAIVWPTAPLDYKDSLTAVSDPSRGELCTTRCLAWEQLDCAQLVSYHFKQVWGWIQHDFGWAWSSPLGQLLQWQLDVQLTCGDKDDCVHGRELDLTRDDHGHLQRCQVSDKI